MSAVSESEVKSVLVTHLERKVVFRIPKKKLISDMTFLVKEFKKKFHCDATTEITFQRFDVEWDQLIDLEENDVIHDKDKLTVVISLMQHLGKVSCL